MKIKKEKRVKKDVAKKIRKRFEENEGEIFSINDFYDIGIKNTIKSNLLILEGRGYIFRIINGLYVKPIYNKMLREYIYPSPNIVAEKIANKFSWNICHGHDKALNLTGLSTQVPNEYVYITDGPYRKYNYKGIVISFKHTNQKFLFDYSNEFALMFIAIKALGENNIRDIELLRLASFSKKYVKDDLVNKTAKLPSWIRDVLFKLC